MVKLKKYIYVTQLKLTAIQLRPTIANDVDTNRKMMVQFVYVYVCVRGHVLLSNINDFKHPNEALHSLIFDFSFCPAIRLCKCFSWRYDVIWVPTNNIVAFSR